MRKGHWSLLGLCGVCFPIHVPHIHSGLEKSRLLLEASAEGTGSVRAQLPGTLETNVPREKARGAGLVCPL